MPQDGPYELGLDLWGSGLNESYVPLQAQDSDRYPLLAPLLAQVESNDFHASIRVRGHEISVAREMIGEIASRKPEAPHTKSEVWVTWEGNSFRLSVGTNIP